MEYLFELFNMQINNCKNCQNKKRMSLVLINNLSLWGIRCIIGIIVTS